MRRAAWRGGVWSWDEATAQWNWTPAVDKADMAAKRAAFRAAGTVAYLGDSLVGPPDGPPDDRA